MIYRKVIEELIQAIVLKPKMFYEDQMKNMNGVSLSQRSARHGRPKAGCGAQRAKRAERAQSAFTKNRLKKNVPHKDPTEKNVSLIDFSDPPYKHYTEKKYVPKIALIFLIPNTETTPKKNYVPFRRTHMWINLW